MRRQQFPYNHYKGNYEQLLVPLERSDYPSEPAVRVVVADLDAAAVGKELFLLFLAVTNSV